jgi:hypothetical protein
MSSTMSQIREKFYSVIQSGCSFEQSISEVSGMLNQMPNADNFQLAFDSLYWHWGEDPNREVISPKELDRITMKYSKFGEYQEAVIQKQIDTADEWRKELEAAGMSPEEALFEAKLECEFIVDTQKSVTAIADSPSEIAIPQHIVLLYRMFYRSAWRNTSRTNILKPLLLAKEVISSSSSVGEELVQEVHGKIAARMEQVRNSTAVGRWVIKDRIKESTAIRQFSEFIVFNVLGEKFNSDRSMFSSRKITLIEDACDAIYRIEQHKELK